MLKLKVHLKFFLSRGAWEMLYVGDTVTLQSEGIAYVLENTNMLKITNAEGLRETKVAVVSISNLGEHFGVSPLRQRQDLDFVTCCSADWASLSVPDLNKLDLTSALRYAQRKH
jgi:hypothetical protein